MGHHASVDLVYGYRLRDDSGEWAFREYEPADESNDWTSRFTMPWFVEKYGDDTDDIDDGMADPVEALDERLTAEGVEGVTFTTFYDGGDDGEYVLAVKPADDGPRTSTPEEGIYPVDLPALVALAESGDWDARLERAREALGITFTDPDARPGWFFVVSSG